VNPANLLEFRCPLCGGPLDGFDPEDTCIGVRCLKCEYIGAVATNPNQPCFDATPYSVWVLSQGRDQLRVAVAVGVALGISAKAALQLIEADQPVRGGVQATEVQRLYGVFHDLGLGIRVEPDFPWRLEARRG
jgi:hypothetical protein